MLREIVVAHYQEDVNWLNYIVRDYPDVKISLYNKDIGCAVDIHNAHNYYLENVGGAAHTYLHHIIENYTALADFTIFCEGNAYDYISNEMMQSYMGSDSLFEPEEWFRTENKIAQFVVHTSLIQSKSLEFYRNEMNSFYTDADADADADAAVAHSEQEHIKIFERAWGDVYL
jgi:hypothetical protein